MSLDVCSPRTQSTDPSPTHKDVNLSKVDSMASTVYSSFRKIFWDGEELKEKEEEKGKSPPPPSGVIWFGPLGLVFLLFLPVTVFLVAATMLWEAVQQLVIRLILRPLHLDSLIGSLADSCVSWVARTTMKEGEKYKDVLYTCALNFLLPPLFFYLLYVESSGNIGEGAWWRSLKYFLGYHIIRMGPYFRFFAYTHTLVHMEAHLKRKDKWFLPPFSFLNRQLEWGLFVLYGGVPENFSIGLKKEGGEEESDISGHNKIHHAYLNGFNDVHSNLEYDRTNPRQFADFLLKFFLFWTGITVVDHMYKHDQPHHARQMMVGMASWSAFFLGVASFSPYFALAYLFYPLVETVFFLGAVAYTWHAFIDPEDPTNEYVSSVTILEGQYNVRGRRRELSGLYLFGFQSFNADYHVVHHDHPDLFYKDAPKLFASQLEEYKKHRATIFRDTQPLELFFLIITGNLDRLADLFVDLDDKNPMDKQQIKELLASRLSCRRPLSLGWAPRVVTPEEELEQSLVTLQRRLPKGARKKARKE